MIKVKVIARSDIRDFEHFINEFIKDKNIIDIKYNPVCVDKVIAHRALIIYKEKGVVND